MNFDRRKPYSFAHFHDVTGTRHGTFTVVRHLGFAKKYSVWVCRCYCGTTIQIRTNGLVRLTTCQECRRRQRESSRRLNGIYATLYNEILSQNEPNSSSWRDSIQFEQDVEKARPKGARGNWWTVIRRNPKKPWGAKNFEWRYTGQTIVVKGVSMSIAEAARTIGISRQALDQRLKNLGPDATSIAGRPGTKKARAPRIVKERNRRMRETVAANDAVIIQQIQRHYDEISRLMKKSSREHERRPHYEAKSLYMSQAARRERRRLMANAVAEGKTPYAVAVQFGVSEATARTAVQEFQRKRPKNASRKTANDTQTSTQRANTKVRRLSNSKFTSL